MQRDATRHPHSCELPVADATVVVDGRGISDPAPLIFRSVGTGGVNDLILWAGQEAPPAWVPPSPPSLGIENSATESPDGMAPGLTGLRVNWELTIFHLGSVMEGRGI